MNHKTFVKPTLSILTTIILFISLIFIIDPVYAEETTEIGLISASDTISVGEEFIVTIYINPTVEVGGWEIYELSFSEEYVTANMVSSGSEWDESFDGGNIDNTNGKITEIQSCKMSEYPSVNHTACTISFSAVNSGLCSIEIVRVQVTDTSFNDLSVSTNNVTITLTGNGDGDGDGDGDANQPPIANASASETSGFVGMHIQFNGSLSYDADHGYIKSWRWDFGDGTNGNGEATEHIYHEADNYTVTLTVTDDKGATDTDVINIIIIPGANIPPKKPVVTGPDIGHKNIAYEYTANSTDDDNDTISYIFNWGDGKTTTTDYLPEGIMITQNHSWTSAGRYILEVQATDNQTYSQIIEYLVFIDAINVGDIGYLTDDNGNGTYDAFHNSSTGDKTLVRFEDGYYLIDDNGDGKWDYVYNSETYELEEYVSENSEDKKTTPSIGFIGVILVGIFFILIKKKQFL